MHYLHIVYKMKS